MISLPYVIAFYIITETTTTEAKLDRITSSRKLTPEDIGAYHTDAFDILGEKYSQNKPSSQLDVMMDVGEILAGYCPLDDSACVSNAYKTIMKEFDITAKGMPRTVEYPADFDSDIKQSVESMFSTIHTINEHNLDEVLSSLEDIQYELKDMDGVNKVHQISGLAGVSVAIESTKLWHGTYHDENHPLHGMIGHFDREGGQRKLQWQMSLTNVIWSDISAVFNFEFEEVFGNPSKVIAPAIAASAAAFFIGDVMITFNPDDNNSEVDTGETDENDESFDEEEEEDNDEEQEEEDNDEEVVEDEDEEELDEEEVDEEQEEEDSDEEVVEDEDEEEVDEEEEDGDGMANNEESDGVVDDDVFDEDIDDFICSIIECRAWTSFFPNLGH